MKYFCFSLKVFKKAVQDASFFYLQYGFWFKKSIYLLILMKENLTLFEKKYLNK